MAELIGVLASILQLLEVITNTDTLIKELHNAPKEQQQLFSEIKSLRPLVAALGNRIQRNHLITGIQEIEKSLYEFEKTLKKCTKRLQAANGLFSRVSRPLAWSLWNKKEVKQDLDKIERFKSLLNTWLTMDIWYIHTHLPIRHVSQQQTKNHADNGWWKTSCMLLGHLARDTS
ncbi:hypothetical protein B0H14DRAFT_2592953 [Mycena olivaceomarginata]|nr:hypothetical protein B0H14DRAFT_2592953 [Mycena olivaceomarginata]